MPLPKAMSNECKNTHQVTDAKVISISSSMSSASLQNFCGYNSICTIPSGVTVEMNSNLNVAALIVKGKFIWNEVSQVSSKQWLCSGYIAVKKLYLNFLALITISISLKIDGGRFEMNLVEKQGFIYVKNNGLKDDLIKPRAIGAYNEGKIYVTGRQMQRTWSLLADKGFFGMRSISILHNPQEMVIFNS